MDTETIKNGLKAEPKGPTTTAAAQLLSSGSLLANLACSGRPQGAYAKGSYIYYVGDSDSGKTWFTMTCLAEAARSKRFKDYKFIYDGPEGGAMMDIEYYFGARVAERLETPYTDDEGNEIPSQSLDDFYFKLHELYNENEKFIYILDSMDALEPNVDIEKHNEDAEEGDTGGTYGLAKAKMNSTNIRKVVKQLQRSGSILFIISQTRDNIGRNAMFNPKTRAGGRSLKFYADLEIWTSVKGKVEKEVKRKKRRVGNRIKFDVKRSRITGKKCMVEVPILNDLGIDETGSLLEWLNDEKVDTKTAFGKGTIDQQAKRIEDDERLPELRKLVYEHWQEIEKAKRPKRKRRYE